MSKQTELEKLQRKINAFLKLNNELIKVGMYNISHDNDRRYQLIWKSWLICLKSTGLN